MADSVSKRSVIYEILFDVSKGKTSLVEAESALKNATGSAQGFNKSLNNFGKTLSGRQVKGGLNDLRQGISLLGLENQKFSSAMLKATGVMSILKAAQTAYTVVVGQSTGALKIFRVALASTGVGLAVLALTELAKVFGLFNEKADEGAKKQDKFNEALEEGSEIAKAYIDAIKLLESRLGITARGINDVFLALQNGTDISKFSIAVLEDAVSDLQKQLKETTKEDFALGLVGDTTTAEQRFKMFTDKTLANIKKIEAVLNPARNIPKAVAALEPVKASFIEQEKALLDLTDALQKYYDLLANPPSVEKTDPNKVMLENLEKAEGWLNASNEINSAIRAGLELNQLAYEKNTEALGSQLEQNLITQEQYNEAIKNLNKEKAKEDLAFTLAEIAISSGLAIANIIKAASSSSITAFDAAAQIATGIATILAGIATATRAVSAAKYEEGTEFLERGKNPKGTDTIPVMANEGEAIIPTDKNKKYKGLSKAMIDDDVDSWIRKNYVDPSLAVSAMDNAIKDSRTLDYSERFYRQFLATQEGNYNGKKMTAILTSIDSKIGSRYDKWYGR